MKSIAPKRRTFNILKAVPVLLFSAIEALDFLFGYFLVVLYVFIGDSFHIPLSSYEDKRIK